MIATLIFDPIFGPYCKCYDLGIELEKVKGHLKYLDFREALFGGKAPVGAKKFVQYTTSLV